jgi:hypothetical protein
MPSPFTPQYTEKISTRESTNAPAQFHHNPIETSAKSAATLSSSPGIRLAPILADLRRRGKLGTGFRPADTPILPVSRRLLSAPVSYTLTA